MTLLLFALQLTANLSAASAVSATGYDAARRVAARSIDQEDPASVGQAKAAAESELRAALEGLGTIDEVRWSVSDGSVHLHVVAHARRVAPRALTRPIGLDRIERDLVVAVETAR